MHATEGNEVVTTLEVPASEPSETVAVPTDENQRSHTRLQNNIKKPKQRTHGTMAYLAKLEFSEPETTSLHCSIRSGSKLCRKNTMPL
jgi:hypothetical protein